MNEAIIDQLKARRRELSAELARIEKALAALTIDTSEKPKKPRAPGAPKLGRPKKTQAEPSAPATNGQAEA